MKSFAKGGKHVAHRLRQDDHPHRGPLLHPQRTGRLHLSDRHRLDTRPEHLGYVGAVDDGQGKDRPPFLRYPVGEPEGVADFGNDP